MALWWSWGGGVVFYERGTPVPEFGFRVYPTSGSGVPEFEFSLDTTQCKVTPVFLHGVVSPFIPREFGFRTGLAAESSGFECARLRAQEYPNTDFVADSRILCRA